MKALVAVKRVIDPYVKIRVSEKKIVTNGVKMAINPFDEIAIEEALRLREKSVIDEVVLVTVGDSDSQETLRQGLALGADRGILVESTETFCSLNIAKILRKIVATESPDVVLMGKQSIDGDNNQTPQMLAALLSWPQATFASKVIINEGNIEVTRELDTGLETIKVKLPAVISTDLRLNEPRYPSLPNIMKAKQKPIDVVALDSLDLDLARHMEVLEINAPSVRTGGVILNSVAELVSKLQETGLIASAKEPS